MVLDQSCHVSCLHACRAEMSNLLTTQVMAVAGLDSSRVHCLSPTRSTRSWATPPATPASKDQSPYYTPLIRVDGPHRESISGSHVSVRKSSWYTDDPEYSQRTYSPIHLQVPPEYHHQYHQKRGSATSLVEAVSFKLVLSCFKSKRGCILLGFHVTDEQKAAKIRNLHDFLI